MTGAPVMSHMVFDHPQQPLQSQPPEEQAQQGAKTQQLHLLQGTFAIDDEIVHLGVGAQPGGQLAQEEIPAAKAAFPQGQIGAFAGGEGLLHHLFAHHAPIEVLRLRLARLHKPAHNLPGQQRRIRAHGDDVAVRVAPLEHGIKASLQVFPQAGLVFHIVDRHPKIQGILLAQADDHDLPGQAALHKGPHHMPDHGLAAHVRQHFVVDTGQLFDGIDLVRVIPGGDENVVFWLHGWLVLWWEAGGRFYLFVRSMAKRKRYSSAMS